MAVCIVGLFALGLWMTSLSYYDVWYTRGPYVHEGIGIVMAAMLVFRLYWRLTNPKPDCSGLKAYERVGSTAAHWGMYAMLVIVLVSGYLISTADGRSVSVFDIFSIPSAVQGKTLADQAGAVHYYVAIAMIVLASIHGAAALKHHFIDKDDTLRRMLPGMKSDNQN